MGRKTLTQYHHCQQPADELLELDQTGIHVAEYLTGLPSRQLLEQKLHEAVALSKARLENRVSPAVSEVEANK